MSKITLYGNDARDKVVAGVDAVADMVKITVGPKGRNVLLRDAISIPTLTNDGVTIAKAIQLKDNVEDAGARLIISAAEKTNDVAGDGTTSTVILAQEMLHQFYDNYNSGDVNVVQIQKDMINIGSKLSEYLKSIALPVNDNEAIKRVATISSGSEDTGKLIAEAFESAGEFGSVIVEDSKIGVDGLSKIEGMKITNGSVSSYLLTDKINQKTVLKDVNLLICKDKIESVESLFKVVEATHSANMKLLIMCEDIDFEPLNMLIMNKVQGRLPFIAVIRLPGFGELREQLLEDISIATGATIIGRDNGTTLNDFTLDCLGDLDEAVISMDDTIMKFKDVSFSGENLQLARENRVNELRAQLDVVDNDSVKRRIANLTSGISIIEVGGNSEVEIKDKKLRIEDALNSVQSAIEEGIVAGGGYSFLQAFMDAQDNIVTATYGEAIVYNSLTAVTKQIAQNSGANGDEVVSNCYSKKLGYNALSGEYEDLVSTGVINSVKVDRYSLLNAISVVAEIITMGGLVIDENEPDSNVFQLQAPITLPPV